MQASARALTRRLRPVAAPSPFTWLSPSARASSTPRSASRDLTTSPALYKAKSGSSSQWLDRQRNDPYVRARAAHGLIETANAPSSYVSRAAFKLIELKEAWTGDVRMLRPGMTVVDLGAAPGGWIQAADQVLNGKGTIIGCDLLPLHTSIPKDDGSIRFVQGDFTTSAVQERVRRIVEEETGQDKVDLVVSDMMGNATGNMLRDSTISLELCETALSFARAHLAPSTADPTSRVAHPVQFVVKHFTSAATAPLRKRLASLFYVVKWIKPHSSRKGSREGFFVCAGLRPGARSSHPVDPDRSGSAAAPAAGHPATEDLFF
ncbi:putative 23S rRNA (uridine(2552)-2'-O)-methyltransferase [Rhodotorula taiwanensis]|uniref:rRNA methyltransferase 2, mitochondrial n=1 Tax=Rhodotorula taiwanensis TaxID=741276 RepID=A0A2S5BFY8_9BASI|nr:putative 23S rRNA (uridine(2552)-2'-O)-methyltransferase [Rhodotorula taiwanensis]